MLWYVVNYSLEEAKEIRKKLLIWKRRPPVLYNYEPLFLFLKHAGLAWFGAAVYYFFDDDNDAVHTLQFWHKCISILQRIGDSNSTKQLHAINHLKDAIKNVAKTIIYSGIAIFTKFLLSGEVVLHSLKGIYESHKEKGTLRDIDVFTKKKIRSYSVPLLNAYRDWSTRFVSLMVWKSLAPPFLAAHFSGLQAEPFHQQTWAKS